MVFQSYVQPDQGHLTFRGIKKSEISSRRLMIAFTYTTFRSHAAEPQPKIKLTIRNVSHEDAKMRR